MQNLELVTNPNYGYPPACVWSAPDSWALRDQVCLSSHLLYTAKQTAWLDNTFQIKNRY
jgi:hypothetical protein